MKTEELYRIFQEHPVISTDSRLVTEGSLFFGLKGEHFDGNDFASQALEKGAAFAVIDDAGLGKKDRFILVEDVLETLQQLASYHRKQYKLPVIAITGTNGKTTTKELMNAVLSGKYKTVATEGNLNNHIGVPVTLLRITKDTEIAIVEMGANHLGEIATLCNISDPRFGLITNIGKAHLEGFEGYAGVIRAKTELYHYIKEHQGRIFLNGDDPLLIERAAGLESYTYGLTGYPDIKGTLRQSIPFVSMEITCKDEVLKLDTRLFGSYNATNILAAVAAGIYFKIDPGDIRIAIESYVPSNNRSQLAKSGSNTLILDAYNANPDSMKLAIQNFMDSGFENKIVVLGDMLELGRESDKEHIAILCLLEKLGLEKVYLVGPEFMRLNTKREWHCFQDSELARLWFEHHKPEGASILVKGSRGIKLEKVIEVL